MKIRNKGLAMLIWAGLLAMLLAGCGSKSQTDTTASTTEGAAEADAAAATSLEIVGPNTVLTAGKTYQMLSQFMPAGSAREEITWTSSDAGIVSVSDSGVITALKEGSCTITGSTASGLFGSAEVSVKLPDNPKLVLKSPESVVMQEGETYQLEWYFLPDNGETPAVTWESATPEHLTVSEKGLLTAKTRILTSVTGTYGPENDRQTVTVNVEITPPEWELVGFNSQAILTGTTLEFQYPSREVTGQDGQRLKPGKFVVFDYFNDPSIYIDGYYAEPTMEKALAAAEKIKGGTTIASVTFDKPGGYKAVYYGEDWEEECFILVSDELMPDTIHMETGETVKLMDVASWDIRTRIYLYLENFGTEYAVYNSWESGGNPLANNICWATGRSAGTVTIGLYDLNNNCLDTCRVVVSGWNLQNPTVWASLDSVSAQSAVINAGADSRCIIDAFLCAGTPTYEDFQKRPDFTLSIDHGALPGPTGGAITFDELEPGQTYTVFVYGTSADLESLATTIRFTTPKLPAVGASLGAVDGTSASVHFEADENCTFMAGLYPGDSEIPETGSDIQSRALQYKTVSDTMKGSVIFDKLQSDTPYSVFVCGVNQDGYASLIQRVDFTTRKVGTYYGSGSGSDSDSDSGSGTDYRPVTDITGVPAQILAGQTVLLKPVVQPLNATRKTITWSIPDGSNGRIAVNGSSLTGVAATEPGKPAVLRATIARGGSKGGNYTKDFSIQVLPPVALTLPAELDPEKENPLPAIYKNSQVEYGVTLDAAGGVGGPYTFLLKDSTLPDGWRLNPVPEMTDRARLTGMPSATGSYKFTIRVVDRAGNYKDYRFALEVAEPGYLPVVDITGIPSYMIQGETITLEGRVQPGNATNRTITWEILDEFQSYCSLTGNELESNGGTGTARLRATVENGLPAGDYTKDFQIEIVYQVALSEPLVLDGVLPPAQVGREYAGQRFKAINGKPEETRYRFRLTEDSRLPAGLVLEEGVDGDNTSAMLKGTPTEAGSFQFTVRVSDSDGNYEDFPFSLEVSSTATPSTPARLVQPYRMTVDITADEEEQTATSSNAASSHKRQKESGDGDRKGGKASPSNAG